jgi:cellulose synthase/poly-beta-1,6-N-acetylglucosamine synthase-like glycosyltransferase
MSDLAFVAMALIAYTYAGYPLLIGLWASVRRPRAPHAGPEYEPTVSICLAVCNGDAHIEPKLRSLLALDYPREKLEIVVCSDGSTDRTEDLLDQLAREDPRIIVLRNCGRLGKPTAVNQLRAAAHGEVLIMTDVRQPLAQAAARALVGPLADPTVGCVSGNLVLSGPSGAGAYWRYEKMIRRAEGRLGTMVGVSGSIYAVRRADLPALPRDVILDDMYVPLSIALGGKRVVFCEAAEAYDEAFDDEREFGRKVRTLAGNYQLIWKLPKLLVPGVNRAWFELVSHKLLRLFCPFALAALLLLSAALSVDELLLEQERAFWRALLCGQLAFYALAAAGARGGRIGGVARTFVVLNAAAVVGLWRFARRSQTVIW